MNLWATKSIAALRAEAEATDERSLKRALGAAQPDHARHRRHHRRRHLRAHRHWPPHCTPARPCCSRSCWPAIACGFAGLCYAEMASTVPVAGSAYTYSYATMGEFVAWIIGWDLVLEYAMGAATVAVGWSGILREPASTTSASTCPPASPQRAAPLVYRGRRDHCRGRLRPRRLEPTGALFNLPAVLIVRSSPRILVVGIKESAKVNNVIVILKVAVVLLFIAFGLQYVNPANWQPFIPPNTGSSASYGWSGVFRGAGLVFFAYIGFDAVSTAAQEAKNPQRDMPIGILGSLVICTILYVLVALVLTGLVHYTELNVAAPGGLSPSSRSRSSPGCVRFDHAGRGARPRIGGPGHASGPARVFYAMSRDGLLGPWAGKVHPRFRTPYLSTIYVGIIVAFITGTFPIQILGELVNIGTLLAFVLVCVGVWMLRREAARPRPAVQDSAGAAGADPGRAVLPGSDGDAAGRHLDPAAGLAAHRLRDLLRLRPEAQPAAARARRRVIPGQARLTA